MKITVEFESLKEFEEFRGSAKSDNSVVLDSIQRQLSVQSVVLDSLSKDVNQRELHKDIKDVDDLLEGEDLNVELYDEVEALLKKLRKLDTPELRWTKKVLYDETGDYEFKPIYSEDALNRIKSAVESMIWRLSA